MYTYTARQYILDLGQDLPSSYATTSLATYSLSAIRLINYRHPILSQRPATSSIQQHVLLRSRPASADLF